MKHNVFIRHKTASISTIKLQQSCVLAHRIKPYLGFGVPVGSAYLSARRTFGRPIGRPKVRFNPSPPPCFGRKNGRRYGRTSGRPIGVPSN